MLNENSGKYLIYPLLYYIIIKLPKIAEFNAAHTLSLWAASSCQPTGLSQGLEYANKLNAS